MHIPPPRLGLHSTLDGVARWFGGSHVGRAVLLSSVPWLAACNGILGIERGHAQAGSGARYTHVPDSSGAGGNGVVSATGGAATGLGTGSTGGAATGTAATGGAATGLGTGSTGGAATGTAATGGATVFTTGGTSPQTTAEGGGMGGSGSESSGGATASGIGGSTSSGGAVAAGASSIGSTNAGSGALGGATSTAGSATTSGTAGAAAGAGSVAGQTSCPTCSGRKLRLFGTTHTTSLGSITGGGPAYDLCPNGQALVGLTFRLATEGYNGSSQHFISATAVCAPFSEPLAIDVGFGNDRRLPTRGEDRVGVAEQQVHCPVGSAVTSFSGASETEPNSPTGIAFGCAKLTISNAGRDAHVEIGSPQYTQFAGINPNQQVPLGASCPAGEIARGIYFRSGAWVDGITLICGVPTLVYPETTPCEYDFECASGHCNGTCRTMTCPAPAGCSCALFGTVPYVLCTTPQPNAVAMDVCKQAGLLPACLQSPPEIGWLSSTMYVSGLKQYWVGAHGSDDRWACDDPYEPIVPATVPGRDNQYNFWMYTDADLTSEDRTCLVAEEGRFRNSTCDVALPFACELAL